MKPKTKQATSAPQQRDSLGRWVKGYCPSPQTQLKPGHKYRYPPGVSGNPAGTSKARAEFERLFYAALMGQGKPDEAARLLWAAARKKEPWAVQLLLQKIAPDSSKLKLEVTRGQDEIDFTKLNDAEIEQLERILERARPAAAITGRESPA
jgi:hypothetical protein